ncbi:DNA topoisomerase IB [Erythrobacter litoralis]|uniref:DNA topoisomerase IB n=1 Tax=Erythrobacter litoralis TaxID=39960 RepID=UPI002434FD38|nr:DNA topoisomerase IB [Erythrobacter litoralis]MDG6080229.1 DNA topoisomerase IB [Erythrobacter litoralis]
MNNLIYVDDELPGITRKGAGKGWAYYDPEGALIKDRAEKKRLNAIALPPAYTDEWFCPAPNGHILATGIDAKGRKQYRYHPDFRAARESEKFDKCLAFGNLLPLVRKRVEEDLDGGKEMTWERAVASVVRLLDLGAIRVGNEGYAERNKSFGATTLRRRHAEVTGKTLRLRYKGKSGKMQDVKLSDKSLAKAVRKMQDLAGQNVFKYVDEDGTVHAVDSGDVNEYLEEAMGERFTAKNFRTWHATVLGFECLREGDGKMPMKALLECVAEHLGNTPAVTRKSYIHPAVLDLVDGQEEWRASLKLPRATRWQTREERAVIEMLQECPNSLELLQAA